MELNEKTFEQIHAYLRGEGTEEERMEFEQRIIQDPQLAEEVTAQQRIKSGLKANKHKQRFAEIHAQLESEGALPTWEVVASPTEVPEVPVKPLSQPRPLWRYWAAAASVIIVAGVGWYIYTLQDTTPHLASHPDTTAPSDTTTIPRANQETPEPASPKPSSTPATPKTITPDYKALFAQNFSRTPSIGSPFSTEKLGVNPTMVARWQADTAALHEGIRLLDAGRGRSALVEFQKVEKSRFEELRQHGEWYVALALLWQSEYGQTRERLRTISTSEQHFYQTKAKNLLAKIDKK
ncbi:hypothetical protein P1X15_29675 [Runella sp. MFBS21]|uniref:hypothetical protein n=1 Tax=Runella sp. MFBS21 TaxID=3034018 RepID=UPI0023F658A4|nr:hypothetical protein [Runella sp. MFBS21]MDF7821824.1 hypothetical protein [Runella sp. MFBS21]